MRLIRQLCVEWLVIASIDIIPSSWDNWLLDGRKALIRLGRLGYLLKKLIRKGLLTIEAFLYHLREITRSIGLMTLRLLFKRAYMADKILFLLLLLHEALHVMIVIAEE